MRLSLALTTYERPDALAAVLASVAAQCTQPNEVVVADDGSGPETRAVIEQFAARAPYPVHHVRQEHEGFRVARLRNLAIARATGDYVVFVDGDMVLHSEFVADHLGFARHRAFTQGVRLPLDENDTDQLLAESRGSRQPRPVHGISPLRVRGRRKLYAIHNLTLASLLRRAANTFIAVKSCNQGFWREHLVAVNGFDEDFVGWGSEDKELCARLQHHGVVRQTLLFGGIAFHLHHPPASRERHTANERLLAITRCERRTRCAHGLDAHRGAVL